MYYNYEYKIDWDKVQTQEDIIRVLKALDMAFEPNYPHLDELEGLLREVPKEGGIIPITD